MTKSTHNKTRKLLKTKSGAKETDLSKTKAKPKTRKQQLMRELSYEKFIETKQRIQDNIQKFEQLLETEKQKENPDPVYLKNYKERKTKYQWELTTLLVNHPDLQNLPPPPSSTPFPIPIQPIPENIDIEPEPRTEPYIQKNIAIEEKSEPEQPQPPEDIQVIEQVSELIENAEEKVEPNLEDNPPQPLSKETPSINEITLEEPEQNASEKKINEYKKQMERQQAEEEKRLPDSGYLYPTHNDPQFQSKIAKRKEFFDNQYLDEPSDIRKQSNLLCKAEFEHLPHQVFVRNFLSPQTPYRSLLLYHQLGTGKTCTAIGVCEEFRQTMKQIGTTKQQRIIIVGSVNVKSNFRKQLFDEDKIRKIARENKGHFDYEDIQLCTASALMKEINPMNLQGLALDTVIQQVNVLIDQYYSFFGYQSLSNYINRYIQFKSSDLQKKEYTEEYLKQRRIEKIRQHFNGRLFVIDEAHNLRVTSDNGDENSKKTSMLLLEIAEYAENVRFLLLTATPMYNSPEEVLWWVNLLNTNDRRSTLTRSEVFIPAATNNEDTVDIFKPQDPFKTQIEGGRELLQRKLVGYVSYLRGENPFTFPYRIYPSQFLTEESEIRTHTMNDANRPLIQMNGKPISTPLQNIPVFLTPLKRDSYQYIMYDLCIKYLKQHTFTQKDKFGNQMERKGFEDMGGFGYTLLQIPVECLDIVFPSLSKSILTSVQQGGALPMVVENIPTAPTPPLRNNPTTPPDLSFVSDDDEDEDEDDEVPEMIPEEGEEEKQNPSLPLTPTTPTTTEEGENAKPEKILRDDPEWIKKKNFLSNSIGEKGMRNTMSWKTPKTSSVIQKTQYEYKPEIFQNFGRFLSPENLPQYSHKIGEIQQRILRSTGVVMIYSEYIDGGVVPFALALEELGFERHVPVNSRFTKTLFDPSSQDFQKIAKRDATTMRLRNDPIFKTAVSPFKQAKYALITGNSSFSPNNSADISLITSPENKLGELVKVVLITRAASEGVDFKFLRQIHILEPWYNMNRIEQIIGRGVRNNSHCMLPWEERNVEIYLHGTLLPPVEIISTTPVPEIVSPQDTKPTPPDIENISTTPIQEEMSVQDTKPTPPDIEETPTPPDIENISTTPIQEEMSVQDTKPTPSDIEETPDEEISPQDTEETSTTIPLENQGQKGGRRQKGGADDLIPLPPQEEAADIYIYRLAERKAKKIGQITRLLKESAVDCILNIRQTKFTIQDLETIAANQNLSITLSTDQKQITYKVGDKPFTDICDYMDNCAFQCMDPTKITETALSTQTYQYSHIKSNRPMIMKRIRQLFREDMVYTNKQLVQLIQGSKEYPEVQIYDTLSYFLQNDNEILIDKYGRIGRLTNHGKYYAFLPIELQDTQATLLERSRPIDYKRPSLHFEPSTNSPPKIPTTVAPPPIGTIMNPTAEDTLEASEPEEPIAFETNQIQQLFEQTIEKISNWIAQMSNTSVTNKEVNEDKSIKNWFRSVPASKYILQYLFKTYPQNIPQPTEEEYLQFSLYHAMDLLTLDEKLALAFVIFSPPKETESFVQEQDRTTPIFQFIALYFKSRFLQGKEKETALVLANFDSKTNQSTNKFWSMTLEPTDETQPKYMGWYPVSDTDIPVFFQQAYEAQFKIPSPQIHYKIGFMHPFISKSKIQTGEIVLNIKNFSQKTRNNKGARVDQALRQNLKIHLQNILGVSTVIAFPPDVEKIATVIGLSVALEMLLRLKDRKPDPSNNQPSTVIAKKYFFTLEEGVVNQIETLFCNVDGALNIISCDEIKK